MPTSYSADRDRATSRRALLGALGSAGLVGLAGCSGDRCDRPFGLYPANESFSALERARPPANRVGLRGRYRRQASNPE